MSESLGQVMPGLLSPTATNKRMLLAFSEPDLTVIQIWGSAETAPPQALMSVAVGDKNTQR